MSFGIAASSRFDPGFGGIICSLPQPLLVLTFSTAAS